MGKTMLILRGNSNLTGDKYADEKGNLVKWPNGALHDQPALDYATHEGYTGEILVDDQKVPVSSDNPGSNSRQTNVALLRIKNKDKP